MSQSRSTAVKILIQVFDENRSLAELFETELQKHQPVRDHGFIKEVCFGVLRFYSRLDALVAPYLKKPLKHKDQDLHLLLAVGAYQLLYLAVPEHAAIFSTVEATNHLKKSWAKALVNGVLRQIQREKIDLQQKSFETEEAQFSHPTWLVERIKKAWPDDWRSILIANNQKPPLSLRVRQRERYLEQLQEQGLHATPIEGISDGIILETPISILDLPGFKTGDVFVQDGAAQYAAYCMDLKPGQRVLDACAAPGSKTVHLFEVESQLKEVVALDTHTARIKKLEDNLKRAGHHATVKIADARNTSTWWDGELFDRILLDAPCSASGVIRRHPDIKWLRQEDDLTDLVKLQSELLENLWPLLKKSGKLVYATCSIFPDENHLQMKHFLSRHADASLKPNLTFGRNMEYTQSDSCLGEAPRLAQRAINGLKFITINEDWEMLQATKHKHEARRVYGFQLLPGRQNMDGFFYAVLEKMEVPQRG